MSFADLFTATLPLAVIDVTAGAPSNQLCDYTDTNGIRQLITRPLFHFFSMVCTLIMKDHGEGGFRSSNAKRLEYQLTLFLSP
jgi:hypothetical protein